MKRLLTIILTALISGVIFAGGLVTNTNQSAMYTRLQSRNASTSVDAVYYNPAGLTRLGNGLFVSLNNQTIGQTKTIISDYQFLSPTPKEYVGKVSAPFFPAIYVAYNTGNFSFSAGFNPVGGGGGAKYDKGLPSFEYQVADLVQLLSGQDIPTTQYSADMYFEGRSVYFGYQANIAYKINDMLSVAAGIRYVTAKNTYNGYIRNITINPTYTAFGAGFNGSMVLASDFFDAGATTLGTLATGATQFATGLGTIVDGGGGLVLLSDGNLVGLTPTQIAQIQGIIMAAGQDPTGVNIAQAQGILNAAAPVFTTKSLAMAYYAMATQDMEVDAEETGTGFTPIIGVNISPVENLNIAVKYEFKTKLDLTTKLTDNKGAGIFTDGEKVIADMPAMLALGVEYKPMDKLLLTGSMNYYFDKNVDYDGSESLNINMIDKNFSEYALGVEYGITDLIRISAGWLGTFTGVNANYQSDLEYDLNTNSIGGGLGLRLSPMVDLNIGGAYTLYKEGSKDLIHYLGDIGIPVLETYKKKTWVAAIGLDLHFGNK